MLLQSNLTPLQFKFVVLQLSDTQLSSLLSLTTNNINQSEIELSIANRVTGMFYVRVLTENAIVTRKLQILQR